MQAGDHGCLSFDTDAEQREVLTSYIHTGLDRHEQVMYFAAGDPTTVLDFLRDSSLEPDSFLASGQFQVMAPEEGFLACTPFDPDIMIGRLRRVAVRAFDAGYQALRLTGEESALRGRPGSERLLEYEQKTAEVFAEGPVLGLCQYDRRVFSPAEISAAESGHTTTVVPDPVYQDARLFITRMFSPPGYRMVGELDIAQVAAWLRWISHAAAGTDTDLHLNLAGLRFIDVAGARMLALLSDRLALRGSRLVLHDLEPAQCIVFHLAGWDRLPNLVMAEEVPV
ncbi:anti-anti-sigma factor [Actinopolymorpha cephalotaxi]|nr:MEDS domain-containing protein [Actinopolymorpha cephalotaxi]SFH09470.1 anti-anti-sigma factor [Actinopolymorpha cephalotaxi]